MIDITKLLLESDSEMDELRYGDEGKGGHPIKERDPETQKPIVVWNSTQSCNLRCLHCYARSEDQDYSGEMSTEDGKAFIDTLADFKAPVLLFSGGEPTVRKDLFELSEYAVDKGLRVVLSTNGTLIDEAMAKEFKRIGFSYIGVSMDGLKETHDNFRQSEGSFEKALLGMKVSREAGLKVGLRFTMTKGNAQDVIPIFDVLEKEQIPRACFYHLAYAGRGTELMDQDIPIEQKRVLMDAIIDKTIELYEKGSPMQVLTVGNHTDGPYLYRRMVRENHPQAQHVLDLLTINGGNRSGVGIASVNWDGTVYPDQFWRNQPVGNINEKPFGDIWTDMSHPLLGKLKHKSKYVTGRCAKCQYLPLCGGNLRARAEAATGDLWAPDPACYLTDEEIGIA